MKGNGKSKERRFESYGKDHMQGIEKLKEEESISGGNN
jgi:hypothetical protein